jgi:DNA-binding response OmpR family regulator
MMTADSRESTIKQARDAGANMVIAKPLSPASLYDRLTWIHRGRQGKRASARAGRYGKPLHLGAIGAGLNGKGGQDNRGSIKNNNRA